jgi:hypothetical protein
MKQGIKTTEFYITVVVTVITATISALVTNGILTSSEAETYQQLVEAIVLVVSLLGTIVVPVSYINSRTEVKAAHSSLLSAASIDSAEKTKQETMILELASRNNSG